MRTSCRFAVAVHVLAVLAYKEGETVASALLAASVNTNPVVIRRLLPALRAAGFIATRQGAGAGSRLRRPPGRINLAQVYRAVEPEETFAAHSQRPSAACPVGGGIEDTLAKVFAATERAMQRELARTTVANILDSVIALRACSNRRRHQNVNL